MISVHLELPRRHCMRRSPRPYHTSFPHAMPKLFTTFSYTTPFQNYCKVWICRLGFGHGSSILVSHHIFFLQFSENLEQSVSGTMISMRWVNSMACLFLWFSPLDPFWCVWCLLFMLQKSVTSRTWI